MVSKILIVVTVLVAYLAGRYYFPSPPVKSPVIEIDSGKVQGRISISRDGREYFEYLGIPYVQPPVGQLRYEPPVPLTKKWDGVRDATSQGPACIQVNAFMRQVEGDEDCLFVNVHSPKLGTAKLPVMVWFHGGIFAFGSGGSYRPDYFMDEDVVLVSVNYRLASFGFLNTGDGVVRGNMGLKDQNAALVWVKKNIQKFGGNPNDVTIFGESAGGASVHYQMLSPMSKGLFQKVIAQSGLVTMPWAVNLNPAKQAKRFATQVNCPTTGSSLEMVKCLKSKDAMDLVSVHAETSDNLRPLVAVFLPTIETETGDGSSFLTQRPRKIIDSGNFHKVPLLTGINDAEGLLISAPIVANRTLMYHMVNHWEESLPPIMMLPEDVKPEALAKIKAHYIKNGDLNLEDPLRHMTNLTNLFGDWVWKVGFHNGATSHAKWITPSNPLFIYYYTYEGEFGLDQLLITIKGDYHPIIEILLGKLKNWYSSTFLGEKVPRYGACHGDELAMLFQVEGLASVARDSKDYQFSKKIVSLFLQFAKLDTKSKKPLQLEFMGQSWKPQEKDGPLQYFKIDLKPKTIAEPFQDSVAFWKPLNLLH